MHESLGELLFRKVTPDNLRIGEVPSFAMRVPGHDTNSGESRACRTLMAKFANRCT